MRFRFGRLANSVATALLVLGTLASTGGPVPQALATGTIGTAAGFEDDDGNLVANSGFDWNSFSPSWNGTAPYQNANATVSGWQFTGLTDAQKTNADTGFAGGTKQDNDCASVIGTSAPNKDDLKRIYVAHKTVNGHIYLELAWVRIPQNTTSPSAHVAFEFNKGTSPCGGSGGLVHRTAGDMLIVYDFDGGSTNNPTLTVRRWIASGTCEVSNDSAPCWGKATNLTASGFADAKVNTTATALDTIAPSNETLGLKEFGEAGIDLTAAGIFSGNACTSFGQVEGVSRSSGNSGTAAMEDIVGPGHVTISNCGNVVIKKVTVPSPDSTNTSFSFTLYGPNPPNSTLPKTFSLTNGQTNSTQVFAGTSYSASETLPANWVLTGATCDNASGTLSGTTIGGISVAADTTTTCTFTNTLQLGAIQVTKQSRKDSSNLSGATFSVVGTGVSRTITTGASGTACTDALPLATYTVTETGAPTGYGIDNPSGVSVTADHTASCSSGTPNAPAVFTDTPLSQIRVQFSSLAGPGVTKASIVCQQGTTTVNAVSENGAADPAFDDTDETFTSLAPGTYTCTVVVDP